MLKYIVNKKRIPLIFSTDILHNEVHKEVEVISAGFVVIKFDKNKKKFLAKCFGESSSLNIKSNATADKEIIESFLNKQFSNYFTI